MTRADKIKELGLSLPAPAKAVAAYVPAVLSGQFLFVSGQLPLHEGKITLSGHFGAGLSQEQGYAAAKLCALNVLAQANAALADLNRIKRVVRLGGFISATPEYTDHSKVMNGASELMEAVFGEAGRHARTTIGVASLPMGAAIEVEALFEVA
jgi:enamine deaminase RidA (YjgF/YER057c/UK114 family)